MTTEELKAKAKELSSKECQQMVFPEDNWEDGYIAGWKACVDQEEWKNLYAEGLEVGMSMLRQAIEMPTGDLISLKEDAKTWRELRDALNTEAATNGAPTEEKVGEITLMMFGIIKRND